MRILNAGFWSRVGKNCRGGFLNMDPNGGRGRGDSKVRRRWNFLKGGRRGEAQGFIREAIGVPLREIGGEQDRGTGAGELEGVGE